MNYSHAKELVAWKRFKSATSKLDRLTKGKKVRALGSAVAEVTQAWAHLSTIIKAGQKEGQQPSE